MKKTLLISFLICTSIVACTNRDGEIIDLINSVKKQNDDLKAQITALKKTTDSALVAVLKVNTLQTATDKKIDLIQTDLKTILTQISSLTTQMTAANADLASLKTKIDALQAKCAELVAQIALLNGSSAQINLKEGLVAYYPFNGNADDLSGNDNHGIINGAIPTTGKNGKENTAYLFNGISNFISLPKPFFNGSKVSQFTLSISFKFNKLIGAQSIWTKNGFWQGAGVYINPEGQIDFGSSIPTFQYQHSTSNLNVIEPNKWYNLILVYDNNNCSMYLNGIKIITLNVTQNQSGTIISDKKVAGFVDFGQNASGNSSSTNLFGCSNSVSTGNTTFMNGIIDDFRLYNRNLTELEIIDLSNN